MVGVVGSYERLMLGDYVTESDFGSCFLVMLSLLHDYVLGWSSGRFVILSLFRAPVMPYSGGDVIDGFWGS